jgi:hypothetical protein
MKLTVSGGQLRKYKKGQAFQLSKDQLQGKAKKGKQHQIDLDESHTKKLQSAARRGKGYRVKGGNIFNDVSKGVNKAVKTVSDTVSGASKSATKKVKGLSKAIKSVGDYVQNDAVDDITDTYGEVNQFALKNDIGGKVEMAKKVVPKSAASAAIRGALVAAGMDDDAASIMADSAVGAVYSVDFGKSLKGQGKKAATGAATGAVTSALKSGSSKSKSTEGSDLKKSGAPKGVNHMAQDYSKQPMMISLGGAVASSNAMRKSTQSIARPRSKAAKAKAQITPDYNTAGGSFKQLGAGIVPAGAGFVPLGGSGLIPAGSGFGTSTSGVVKKVAKRAAKKASEHSGSGARPAKGTQAARDKMAALRAMRKK